MNMFKKVLSFILCIGLELAAVCVFSLNAKAADYTDLKNLILNTDFSQYFNDSGSNILSDQEKSNEDYQDIYGGWCVDGKVEYNNDVYKLTHSNDLDFTEYTVVNGVAPLSA